MKAEITEAVVDTLAWGTLIVWAGHDLAGNRRLFPRGATPLDQWREDVRRIPPWIISDDLHDPRQWGRVWIDLMDTSED